MESVDGSHADEYRDWLARRRDDAYIVHASGARGRTGSWCTAEVTRVGHATCSLGRFVVRRVRDSGRTASAEERTGTFSPPTSSNALSRSIVTCDSAVDKVRGQEGRPSARESAI